MARYRSNKDRDVSLSWRRSSRIEPAAGSEEAAAKGEWKEVEAGAGSIVLKALLVDDRRWANYGQL